MQFAPPDCTNKFVNLAHCTRRDCAECHWNRKNIEADQTDLAIGTVKLIKDKNGILRYQRVNKNGGVV